MKLIISSCEKYHSVLRVTLDSLNKISDVFDVIVITSQDKNLVLDYPYIKFIFYMHDCGWAENMAKVMSDFDLDERVLLWMDDLYLVDNVDLGFIKYFLDDLSESYNYDYLSLYQTPASRMVSCAYSEGLFVRRGEDFQVSCMGSVFKVSLLKKLLVSGESAWDFERKSDKRLRNIDSGIVLLDLSFNLFEMLNLIVKGKVVRWRVEYIGRNDIVLPEMNAFDEWKYKLYMLLHLFKKGIRRSFVLLNFLWR
ncbi:hypothetical protein [Prosthecochloris sp. ZM]|uniref:hypothetical protein n=1 Tax=Prosthecochloris sp. ZM TaxID=2283143 RepID=UPI0011C07028|nr:hypothetical protein [Prosthecochloris sp. ZM]